jgi:hypothetical protein
MTSARQINPDFLPAQERQRARLSEQTLRRGFAQIRRRAQPSISFLNRPD